MRGRDLRWWAWIVVCGLVLGLALAGARDRAQAESTPEGWTRTEATVPFRRADLMGELPEGRGSWSLDHFMSLVATPALGTGETLEITAQLPAGGELQVFPSARWSRSHTPPSGLSSTQVAVPRGGALVLRRTRGGLADGRRLDTEGETGLSCTGTLPIPGPEPFTVQLTGTSQGFDAGIDGQVLTCSDRRKGEVLVLHSGLQRVRVLALERSSTDGQRPAGPGGTLPWILLGVGAVVILAGFEVRSGADPRKVALTCAPLILSGLVLDVDGRAVVEQLRAPGLPPASVGVWIGLAPCLVAKALHLGARLSNRSTLHGLGGPIALGLLTALAVGVARPLHWGALLYLGLAGLALGGVVWANVRTIRGYNLLSLLLVGAALGLTEYGIRFTATGQAWSPIGSMALDRELGWTNTAVSDFEQLDAAKHTTYPIEGFPVAFSEGSEKPRIAAFGGSSTGGAYQNDDLDDFYPARLQEILGPTSEVLNQGVGGWTTFHIRTYLERSLDRLDADVLTLYVGHNDLLTRSRLPYRDLYARWQKGRLAQTVPLASFRLYQGLRYLVQSLADLEQQVAVPLDHARDNLQQISTLAEARGTRVLLITEAVHPDPGALVAYGSIMAEVAAEHENTTLIDGSTLLLERGGGMFIDDCHLSDAGHRFLAATLARELRQLGWVP